MPEIAARMCDDPAARMPAANSFKLYYTADAPSIFGLGVCNGMGQDAHVSVFLVDAWVADWDDGDTPPAFTVIHDRQRIESDATEGNAWPMPVVVLDPGDRIVVWTDTVGVTFNGHGFKMITVTAAAAAATAAPVNGNGRNGNGRLR